MNEEWAIFDFYIHLASKGPDMGFPFQTYLDRGLMPINIHSWYNMNLVLATSQLMCRGCPCQICSTGCWNILFLVVGPCWVEAVPLKMQCPDIHRQPGLWMKKLLSYWSLPLQGLLDFSAAVWHLYPFKNVNEVCRRMHGFNNIQNYRCLLSEHLKYKNDGRLGFISKMQTGSH